MIFIMIHAIFELTEEKTFTIEFNAIKKLGYSSQHPFIQQKDPVKRWHSATISVKLSEWAGNLQFCRSNSITRSAEDIHNWFLSGNKTEVLAQTIGDGEEEFFEQETAMIEMYKM